MEEKIKAIEQKLDLVLDRVEPGRNRLMRQQDIRTELGMKRDGNDWREVRKILIERYGMTRYPNLGYRLPRKNLEKFLLDHYGKHNQGVV